MGKIRFRKELIRNAATGDFAWQLRPVRYSTLGKDELLALASADSGVTVSQLEQAFDAFAHELEQMLCNGHGLDLGDLGKMTLYIRAKAVRTAENVSADLIKYPHIVLTPSVKFKAEMKKVLHVVDPVPAYYVTRRCPFNIKDTKLITNGVRVVNVLDSKEVIEITAEDASSIYLNGTVAPVVTPAAGDTPAQVAYGDVVFEITEDGAMQLVNKGAAGELIVRGFANQGQL